MNIVFFGTSNFAIPSLRAIIESRHKILAVVTQPDRKKGRQLKLSPPPVKVLALTKNIEVYQPQDISSGDSIERLRKLNSVLFVVVSFGQILSKAVLSIPGLYSVNLHGSLLPKYRGAAPTNWAIINGDESTGVTTIKMNERMDEGDIILKMKVRIDKEDTNITLNEKLSEIGAGLLLETIDLAEAGKAAFERQDDQKATYAPKLKKADGIIDWREPAIKIHNKIRGFIPWPGAYTHSKGKILKIWKTALVDMPKSLSARPGEIVGVIKGKGMIVHTGSGDIVIENLQAEGKKILDADSFLRGYRLPTGHIFG